MLTLNFIGSGGERFCAVRSKTVPLRDERVHLPVDIALPAMRVTLVEHVFVRDLGGGQICQVINIYVEPYELPF